MSRVFLFLVFILIKLNVTAQHVVLAGASKSKELAIIPKPRKLTIDKGHLSINTIKNIVYNSDSIKNEAVFLDQLLTGLAIHAKHLKSYSGNEGSIELIIADLPAGLKQNGAYQLIVNQNKVQIKAESRTGIFYGIQTLKQLADNGKFINALHIDDSPAFSWRGYMVDVGRNYQSLELLKQQIDVMASYKLNVFHMHLTEDIAWRLESKLFPQLNAPENMERNKGMYYTENELKELISYCKEKHILFVPEIDMPGHSKAFKKAMKTDMQSDSGLFIVKQLLKEFCETYNLPYIHIGADEVKITNKDFLPAILAYLKSLNKKVIGWEPGGNFDDSTIRQLWMDDAGLTSGNTNIQYIDSRHLYLNHMDPLESVVTIYNRQLADVNSGNHEALGATLCLWPDRAVAKQEDAIEMNAVYPAMLAFAERSWLGNGYKGWVANMNLNGKAAFEEFKDFENRLLKHKEHYFKKLDFPYQKQSDITWDLYGPFKNAGNLTKKFLPEKPEFNHEKIEPNKSAIGGTIILRHWWAPKIKGGLDNPEENTTWYAFRKIWSASDTIRNYWIGFNNFSRSQATDSPLKNTWDNHHSEVWLNGNLINPPKWIHAGQKGNLEIPLIDEGYEFRSPAKLKLKKGWNTVLVKVPIGSFKAKNWNNPEKWMFTFVELRD